MPVRAESRPVALAAGDLTATVLPTEGGVLVDARLGGRAFLAATPWADAVIPASAPAADESSWVARWRGGWQACLPSAGQPDPADPTQGFHGAASQAPWDVESATPAEVVLTWRDDTGLRAQRTWSLIGRGIQVRSLLVNEGDAPRAVVVAEHLVLGGDVLAEPLHLTTDASALQPLDYAGFPAGDPVPWPGAPADRWTEVDEATPARVAGLVAANRATASGSHVEVVVTWDGLPNALLWEELGVSTEAPWNGEVRALGIEPSSVAHGAGTALGDALVLGSGEQLTWSARLEVAFRGAVA